MKYYNKNLVLILVLSCIFLFTGCNSVRLKTFKEENVPEKNVESNEENQENQDNQDNEEDLEDAESLVSNPEDTSNSSDETNDNGSTANIVQPVENVELLIYTVNSSSELEAVTALVPANQELTPKLVVDTVVDSMADQSLLIGVENVTTQDDTVIVSFYADQAPLTNVGAGFEEAILNAIAQSITDNLDDYHKVIYRVEGGPYMSGHIELEIDEVYFEDSK
ncbi:hypothetical protein [Herbinix luporum]|jgi:hypothetical protein|uniref:GerMN domain-containing protein n=1 Tax=Herbinix luporum TaxID=1679721 RepID=A0A0K8J5N6_9FIRM|nr:hypothetical protein [Herbinix luporum]CUH92643.1 hypothetical protein SD1D_1097 [Herbinix luporum]